MPNFSWGENVKKKKKKKKKRKAINVVIISGKVLSLPALSY